MIVIKNNTDMENNFILKNGKYSLMMTYYSDKIIRVTYGTTDDYENGAYSRIRISYDDSTKKITTEQLGNDIFAHELVSKRFDLNWNFHSIHNIFSQRFLRD